MQRWKNEKARAKEGACWPTMWEIAGHFWHCQSVRLMLNHGMKLHVTVWFFQPSPAGPKGLKGGDIILCTFKWGSSKRDIYRWWDLKFTEAARFLLKDGSPIFEIDGSILFRKKPKCCVVLFKEIATKKSSWQKLYVPGNKCMTQRRIPFWPPPLLCICVTGNDRKLWPLSVFAVT